MAKKILFVSTLNLSMNPRVLKEIKLAHSLNYDISFLGFYLGNWSEELDLGIRKQLRSAKYIYLDASRIHFLPWLRHSLLEKFYRAIWKLNKNNIFFAASASTKRTFSLLDFGKKVKRGDFDLVIGHTLGSLHPTSVIADRAGCPFAFDVEDYHPGEHIEGNSGDEIKRRELIMKRILPQAKYISVSSQLIGHETRELCGLDKKQIITVLNFFAAVEFKPPVAHDSRKIKLIWFSQWIGPGRGLEILLSKWDSLKENFDLTLIGSSTDGFEEIHREGIMIIPPLPQSELHGLLNRYDVGLALDLSSRDKNRNIALTNKILAYYQAGLYILATDTDAQKEFINQHPGSGKLFQQNNTILFLEALKNIYDDIVHIRSGVFLRYQEAAKHNWVAESEKLKQIWQQILN